MMKEQKPNPPKALSPEGIRLLGKEVAKAMLRFNNQELQDPKVQQAIHDQSMLAMHEQREPISEPLPEEIDILDQFEDD